MMNWEYNGGSETIFDFIHPKNTTSSYSYVPSKPVLYFTIDFTGDVSNVTEVVLNLACTDGKTYQVKPDDSGIISFTAASNRLPESVWVTFRYAQDLVVPEIQSSDILNGVKPSVIDITGYTDVEETELVATDNYNANVLLLNEMSSQYYAEYQEKFWFLNDPSNLGYWTSLLSQAAGECDSAAGLTVEGLLADGFEAVRTDSGRTVYVWSQSATGGLDYVDFENDRYLHGAAADVSGFEAIIGKEPTVENLTPYVIELSEWQAGWEKRLAEQLVKVVDSCDRLMEIYDAASVEAAALPDEAQAFRLIPRDAQGTARDIGLNMANLGLTRNSSIEALEKMSNVGKAAFGLGVAAGVAGVLSTQEFLDENAEDVKDLALRASEIKDPDKRIDATLSVAAASFAHAGAAFLGIAASTLFVLGTIGVVALSAPAVATIGTVACLASWGATSLTDNARRKIDSAYQSGNVYMGTRNSTRGTRTRASVDPSGYVYEAVSSNRVRDVNATVFEQVTLYDIYDEPYTEIQEWDAEPFEQVNPQKTNENGEFAWNVPDGTWRITFEKSGYETCTTEWMDVPPERKDIRIGMVSLEAPSVLSVTREEDGYLLTLSRYVPVSQIDEKITMVSDGNPVPAVITPMNAEEDPDGVLLVSQIRITPSVETVGWPDLVLTVDGSLTSYAGVPMGESWHAQLGESIAAVEADSERTTFQGETETLEIRLKPEAAAAGRIVSVSVLGDAVRTGTTTAADENGIARFQITGAAPGTARLLIRISGSERQAEVDVTVMEDWKTMSRLTLPAFLTVIESEAFSGIAAEVIVIPSGCTEIAADAFTDCPTLKYIIKYSAAEVTAPSGVTVLCG